jgi:hypothetical protein
MVGGIIMKKTLTILLVFCSVLVFGQTPMRSGLVCLQKYEDNGLDETSNNNDASAVGATYATGKIGNAAVFDGNDYFTMNSHATLEFVENEYLSISAWINTNNISGQKVIFSKLNNFGSFYTGGFQLYLKDDEVRWLCRSSTTNDLVVDSNNANLSINTWYHLVFTTQFFDNSFNFYVDGVELTFTITSPALGDKVVLSSDPFVGTRRYNNILSDYFNGEIDEFMIHRRALKAIEVKQLYNSDNGLLYVQENFKKDNDFKKLIDYVIGRQYFAWINNVQLLGHSKIY